MTLTDDQIVQLGVAIGRRRAIEADREAARRHKVTISLWTGMTGSGSIAIDVPYEAVAHLLDPIFDGRIEAAQRKVEELRAERPE